MLTALLVGQEPQWPLGYRYVETAPYDAVVIGSLTIGQLLHFSNEEVLSALAEGIPVVLYSPGLPEAAGNRALHAVLAGKKRELKSWGVRFTDGTVKKLITAQQAIAMAKAGVKPGPGAVLTPLARDILEGKT